jgi:hypothetical protein
MKRAFAFPIFLAASLAPFALQGAEPVRPAMEITVQANRTSQYPLSGEQIRRLDEATKVSAALRLFYSLYDRWPEDLAELRTRTTGIDYEVLADSLRLEKLDEGMGVVFSDGESERKLLVQPTAPSDEYSRDDARQPGFTFEVKIRRPDAPQSKNKTAYDDPKSAEWAKLRQDASAAMANALARFPDVREAYMLAGFEEDGTSKFGLQLVCDGDPNMEAYNAAAKAYKEVAPPDKGLQLVLLTPQSLAELIEQAKLEPFYRRR